MTDPQACPILVGVDGSPNSTVAASWAASTGVRLGLPVRAVVAWSEVRIPVLDRVDEQVVQDEQFWAGSVAASLHDEGIDNIEVTAEEGPTVDVLLRIAEMADAAMLVVGTRGLGPLSGLLLGSVSRSLLFGTDRPLVVVPHSWPINPPALSSVLVGVDCSPVAERVLAWVARFCADAGVAAVVVRCADPGCERPPGHVDRIDGAVRADTEEALVSFRDLGVEYDIAIAHCDPREALVETALSAGCDMIVIGTRGAGQFRGIGGTASYLARHSPVPLVVIP